MSKTQNDLVNQALTNLGRVAAGQVPPSEDFDAVNAYVIPLVAELSARDLVTIDDLANIEPEIFLPVAELLAAQAASEFGLPGLPGISQAVADPVADAERRIREVMYSRPTYTPVKTEYF